jgi:D-alanyl-D-alanine carboxypeptidase
MRLKAALHRSGKNHDEYPGLANIREASLFPETWKESIPAEKRCRIIVMKKRHLVLLFFLPCCVVLPRQLDYFQNFAFNRKLFRQKPYRYNLNHWKIPLVNRFINLQPQPRIYIVELSTFTPLYERNVQQKFFPASTTKIITA